MAAAATTDHRNAVLDSHGSTDPNTPPHKPLPIPQVKSQTLEAAKNIVVGLTAGIFGEFVEYPFDTIKVRLQSQPTFIFSPGRHHGPLGTFKAAW